jgi:hypothetical protein
MYRILLSVVLVAGVWLGFVSGEQDSAVDAGTAIRLDISAMTRRADLIVEASVRSLHAELVSERRIETEIVLDIDRTFWGEDLVERTVRFPGGVLEDHSGLVIPGMPDLRAGEQVILFLSEKGSTGVRMPVGLAQGKLRVEVALSGDRVLTRNQGRLSVVDPVSGIVRHTGSGERFDYAEVVADIWAAVDRRRSEAGR